MAVVFGPKRSFTGNLYVGGSFNDYNSSGFQYFTKLNSTDASLFSSPPYSTTSFDNYIYAIAKYTSRRILVGGDFTTYNSVDSYKLVSIDFDGNLDNIFRVNTNIDGGIVQAIGTDNYDRVIIGGKAITGYASGTYTVGNIMRLNLDGSFDTTFSNGYAGFNDDVNAIAVQKDGKILVGGLFTTYTDASGFHSTNYIARLNTDGTYDSTFTGSCSTTVNSIVIDEYNDTIIVGGNFTSPGHYIVRFNFDGSVNSDFSGGTDAVVYTLKLDSKRRILAGGDFTTFQTFERNKLVRILPNNIIDLDFQSRYGFNDIVYSVDVDTEDNVFVGGRFSTYTYDPGFPISSSKLIKLKSDSAINESTFNVGSGYDVRVFSVLFSNQ
jgi:hypothetical protein